MITQTALQIYRLFRINDAGRISGTPDVIEAVDDDRAVEAATGLAGCHPAEVWSGARLVATLNQKKQIPVANTVEG